MTRVSVPVLTALAMAFILLAMAPVPARAQGPGGLYGDTLVVATTVNGYLTREGLRGVELGVPVGVLALSVAGSTVLALLAGTFPAVRAARLPAREAVGGA